ncbi:MAG: peptidoglycan DD-metalloendopeptidase family protein [Clostridia bacterium]|nr:peptidoglycan DD-metalloendopeptidase family protein [Clostridia bacterium]
MKQNDKKQTVLRLAAGILAAVTLCYAVPKWSLVIPVRAAETVSAEDKQALKKMEEELRVLRENRTFAQENYLHALEEFKTAELDYMKAQEAKEALDSEIAALESEIEITSSLLNTYNIQLGYYTEQISIKEQEIEERYGMFLDRVRINYEESFTSYLELVLSADSFSNLLYRVDVVASLLDYDKHVLAALDASKKDLAAMQFEYQTLQYKAQETLKALTEQMPLLEQKREESAVLLSELDQKVIQALRSKELSEAQKEAIEASYLKKAEQLAQAEAEIEEKIRRAQEEAERRRKEEEERKRKEEESRRQEEESKRQEEESKRPAEESDPPQTEIAPPADPPQPPPSDPPDTPVLSDKYLWPIDPAYKKITSTFGERISPITGKLEYHNGIDIPAPEGTAIYAAESGTVIISEKHYSYGYYVVIDHGNGMATLYAHHTKNLVSVGDVVTRGQQIALCGSSGDSTGNHLHFCVRKNGTAVNPMNYLNK